MPIVLADATVPGSTDSASFAYTMGSQFTGAVDGSCDASMVTLSKGSGTSLEFSSRGADWLEHTAEFNRSVENPTLSDAPQYQYLTQELHVVHASSNATHGVLHWSPKGRVDLFAAPGPLQSRDGAVPADLTGHNLTLGTVQRDIRTVVMFAEFHGLVGYMFGGLEGPNRMTHLGDGALTVHGDVAILLEDAGATLDDGTTFDVPARFEIVSETGAPPLVEVIHERIHYAFLTLKDATLTVPAAGTEFVCQGFGVHVNGSATANYATGQVGLDGQNASFENRELSLAGAMDWVEAAPTDRAARATAHGQFTAAGLDFAVVLQAHGGPSLLAQVGFWAAVLSAAGGLWYFASKAFGAFFSRLTDEAVVGHASRRRVLAAVEENPNLNLHTLVARTGMSKSAVRYHARMLEQRGRLRTHKVGRDRCFVAASTIRAKGRQILAPSPGLFLRNDPVVGVIVGLVPAEGVRLNHLLRSASDRLQISMPGAWKAVARAQAHGFLRREELGREVWIRCVPPQ